MKFRHLLPVILGFGAAGLAGVVASQPAQAEDVTGRCVTVKHGDTAGFTAAGEGKFVLDQDGVLMSTGTASDADRVDWKYTFGAPVDADTVTEASYTLTKLDKAGTNVNDAALTSYRIYVRINGADGVLIYEPYWNTTGNPPRGAETSWNVLTGKFWTSSTTIPGLPKTGGGPPEKTFAQVRADNPDMLVTGIGLGLGTYNRGTKSLVNDVRFKANKMCTVHEWSTRFVKPSSSTSASPSTSASASASASPSASVSASASAVVSPSVSSGPITGLPVTGLPPVAIMAMIGVAAILGGWGLFRLNRRRGNEA